MARKQITEFAAASSIALTDRFLLQQGATGTAFTYGTVTQLLNGGLASTYSAVTVNGASVPANGMYLPAANTLGWSVNTTTEMQMTGTALSPATSDGLALGTTTLMWSDAFFASGAVLNFDNGDVTLTHSSNTLTLAGGTLATSALTATTGVFSSTATATAFIPSSATVPTNGMYLPAANTLGWAINSAAEMQLTASALSPATSNGLALGTTTLMWSDAFFASGSVLNFDNGDVTLTHSAGRLAFAGGEITATYNSTDASGTTTILTVEGTQSVAHTGNYFAASITPDYDAASGNTLAGLYGVYTSPSNASTGTVSAVYGLSAYATNAAGGTITGAIPVSGITRNTSSGTVTTAYGGRFRVDNTSTGTITTAYGVYSNLFNTNAGGTVTTFYGAFLATPINSGTIVNRWGVYQQDAASQNVLFGRTLVGSATDDASTNLQVNGTFKATGASTLAALSATTGAFTGATTVNLSGTSLTTIAGYVFGAAAVDGLNTAVVLDAAGVYPRYVLRRANGTSASKTAVVLDDVLGALEGRGYDGSTFTVSHAGIDFAAAENWSGAARGGKIAFRTTTNGSITGAAVKMTLENSGALLIGGTTDDGTNKLRVSGGITVDTGNSYKVNNVAVVGATKTGWTAATGTATRTTFVTSTVTTEQLAQRVKALIDDLISHGLIGA